MQEAIDAGADAFFDEKYGETVRTVRVEGYSPRALRRDPLPGDRPDRRLRDHRRAESIGSGMRRIEALTGAGADAWPDGARSRRSRRRAEAAGAQTAEALPDRIRGAPGRAARDAGGG